MGRMLVVALLAVSMVFFAGCASGAQGRLSGGEEAGEAMDAIEKQMNAEELRHLMNYCGNNPRKGILARKIAEKEK